MAGSSPNSTNRLLAALPEGDYTRLSNQFERRPLELKRVLQEPDSRLRDVYFPIDAVVSILTRMEDGPSVEVATIGNEGLVGVTVGLGADLVTNHEYATVQVPGDVISMDARDFRQEVDRGGALASVLHAYTRAFLSQVSQQVACNGLHSVEQRCARWLLLTHDRVGRDEFPMTHEFLAQMLGVRRPSVTVTAGILQKAGFIELARGRVTITDRAGLEGAACECYAVIRDVFEDLLP